MPDTVKSVADRVTQLEAQAKKNEQAIRALLTLLHPDNDHPPVNNDVVPNGVWLHDLVMAWIDEYGDRIPVGDINV